MTLDARIATSGSTTLRPFDSDESVLTSTKTAAEEQERIDYLDRLVNNWNRSRQIREFVEQSQALIAERELSLEGLEENRQFFA